MIDVSFTGEGVIVTVRLRHRRRVCAVCGQTGRQLEIHDRRIKRWRHLDLAGGRCTQRLLLRARDADRMQLSGEQQPDEMLSVAPIILDRV